MDCVRDHICKEELSVDMMVDRYEWIEKTYCADPN